MDMDQKEKKYSAVYVSWATFHNALKQLSQALPQQIDRSVFPGLAWAIQSQLISGMRFLGLVDEDGKPTAVLQALSSDSESEQKKRLSVVLHERYADLLRLDLVKASPLQVRQTMSQSYGVNGDTLERAMRFFVSAAEYAAIAMSPLLASGKSANGGAKKKRSPRGKSVSTVPIPQVNELSATTGTARTVNLATGGTLTLSASLDLFTLNAKDRNFVFELIDKLEAYERLSAKPETSVDVTSTERA